MPRSAARLTPDLMELALKLARQPLRISDICRLVGDRAAELGTPQPSYERIRLVVHRGRERGREPSTAGVAFDVAVRARPPEAFLDHVSRVGVAHRGTSPK